MTRVTAQRLVGIVLLASACDKAPTGLNGDGLMQSDVDGSIAGAFLVSDISPSAAKAGSEVTLRGSGLTEGLIVSIGGIAATVIGREGDAMIRLQVPEGAPGMQRVEVAKSGEVASMPFLRLASDEQAIVAGDLASICKGETFYDIDGNKLAGTKDCIVDLAAGSVHQEHLATGAVTSAAIGPGAVTTQKLAPKSVTVEVLADGSVSGVKLVNKAVTTDKVADGAITAAKLSATPLNNSVLGTDATGGLTWVSLAGSGTGDMLASFWDANSNNKVDAADTATTAVNATNATNATNALQLNGQAASFYLNAANINAGTLADDRLDAAITRDSEVPNLARGALSSAGPITYNTATGQIGIGVATTGAAGSMSAADKSKLDGIAAGATVTNAASVDAAGAVMNSDFTTNGIMLRTGAGAYSVLTDNSANWNAAYTSVNTNAANWTAAHSWGNHAAAGYLTNAAWASPGAIGTTMPNTGVFTSLQANGNLRLRDADTNYVQLQSPALAANYTLTLPTSAGNSLDVLQTNGAGVLSWVALPAAPVTSVNGDTGVVVLDAADIAETGTRKWLLDAERTKLSGIAPGADVTNATNVDAAGAIMNADFASNGIMTRTGAGTYSVVTDNSTNWNTAYGWGNHATMGYLTDAPVDSVNGDTGAVVLDADDIAPTSARTWISEAEKTSYGGLVTNGVTDGDFATNGIMVRTGAGTYDTIVNNATNWDTAHGWGNHASAGYLTSVPWATPGAIGATTPAAGTFSALQTNTTMRFRDGDTNYVQVQAPALAANYALTLPTTAPTVNGQVLSATTTGVLSWITPGGGGDMSSSTYDSTGAAGVVDDADRLGSQLPSYYTDASNLGSGTLPDARLSANVAMISNLAGKQDQLTGSSTVDVGSLTVSTALFLKSGSFTTRLLTSGQTDNVTLTLPPNDGNNNDVLRTDGSGVLTWAPMPSMPASTDGLTQGSTNKYYSDTLARGALSVSAPLSYNSATGAFGITQAGGSTNGYLSSADWTTFSGKQAAIGATTDVTMRHLTADGNINLKDGDSTYVTIKAKSATPSPYTLTLPGDVGTADQYLKTDGSGNLSWSTVVVGGGVTSVNTQTGAVTLTTDNITEGTTNKYYTDAKARTALSVSGAPLTYNNSTGALGITVGTTAGTVAAGNDGRFSDSRNPTGTAGGDLSGSYPNPSIAASTVTSAKILDGTIANVDISNSAAIATSKLSGSISSISGHGLGSAAFENVGYFAAAGHGHADLTNATSASTANTLAKRDANGGIAVDYLQVQTPTTLPTCSTSADDGKMWVEGGNTIYACLASTRVLVMSKNTSAHNLSWQTVFVTSGAYGIRQIDTRAKADAICNSLAAHYPGKFRAVLSYPSDNAFDVINIGTDVRNTNNTQVATTKSQFFAGPLAAAISYTETGVQLPAASATRVWTSTMSDGTYSPTNNCTNWTSDGNSILMTSGDPASIVSDDHMNAGSSNCASARHLYCISQ